MLSKNYFVKVFYFATKGKFKEAEKLCKQGLKEALEKKDEEEIFNYYFHLIELYLMYKKDKLAAIEMKIELEKIFPENPDVLLSWVRLLIFPLTDYNSALLECKKALKKINNLSKKTGIKEEAVRFRCYSLLFVIYLNLGEYQKALRILRIFQKNNRPEIFFNFDTIHIKKELLKLEDQTLNKIFSMLKKISYKTEREKYISSVIDELMKM